MIVFALRNLISRPVRSLLSLLGLTIAILGMVALFSVAHGIDNSVERTFSRIPGLVCLQPGAPIPLFSRLPAKWGSEIAQLDGVSVVNEEVWQRANTINGRMIISPPRFLFGTSLETRLQLEFDPYQQDLVQGRFLSLEDQGTRNAVISRRIAEEFQVGLNDAIEVNGFRLKIVGIYFSDSLLLDMAILLDVNEVRRMCRMEASTVSAFYVEPTGPEVADQLVEQIREKFRGRSSVEDVPLAPNAWGSLLGAAGGWLTPGETDRGELQGRRESGDDRPVAAGSGADDGGEAARPALAMDVMKATDWFDRFKEVRGDFDLLLSILTGIGVMIAVLSIINTMLMSVTERMIEFGILKANGWSHWDVLKLITCESGLLGLAGGVLGSSSGWLMCQFVNHRWPDRIELYASPELLGFGVLFAAVLGVLGGLYPALWATRMAPMEAIRRG